MACRPPFKSSDPHWCYLDALSLTEIAVIETAELVSDSDVHTSHPLELLNDFVSSISPEEVSALARVFGAGLSDLTDESAGPVSSYCLVDK